MTSLKQHNFINNPRDGSSNNTEQQSNGEINIFAFIIKVSFKKVF